MELTDGCVVGLLHPGEMGAAVGNCLTGRGHRVLWASDHRSAQTAARAAAAGLADAGMTANMAAQADVIISVCPPHAALDMAWAVQGFGGVYVDANAISPDTAREVAGLITAGGGRYVDGSIIGPPPPAAQPRAGADGTRLYLSGEHAGAVRALFDGTALEARIAGPGAVAASAVKMAYAAWTKGTAALLLAARALAEADDVEGVLLAEWELSQPDLAARSRGAAQAATAKGWRWVAEMEEIADAMAGAGLPDGFHQAAAEIFRRAPHPASPPAGPDPASTAQASTGQAGTGQAGTGQASADPVRAVLAALTGSGPPTRPVSGRRPGPAG